MFMQFYMGQPTLNIKEEPNDEVQEEYIDISRMLEVVKAPKRRGRPSKTALLTCALCSYQTENHIYLQDHMKIHSDKVAHECPFCHCLFSQKGNLQAHIRTHTKERPFKCHWCPFAATQKGNLMVHYRKHTKERPYRCPICDFGAAQLANLRSHLQRKHRPDSKTDEGLWLPECTVSITTPSPDR